MTSGVPQDFWGFVLFSLDKYGAMFLKGAAMTLYVAIAGTIIGFLIGLFIGIVRTLPIGEKDSLLKKIVLKTARAIFTAYVTVFRGTPMIVQAVVIYYGFAQYAGIDMSATFAALFVVSINTGAYMAEIVRGGIVAVDVGQFEGAESIGMTHWQTMVNVVLPQAIRSMLPSIGNEFIINIKDTSVLNVISVTELFFMTKSAAGTYMRFFEPFLIACAIYLVMTYSVSKLLRLVERKLEGPDSFTIHGGATLPNNKIVVRGRKL